MKGFFKAVGRVLLITLGGAVAAAGVVAASIWFINKFDLDSWLRRLLGEKGVDPPLIVLTALFGCLALAAPEGLRLRSFRRWLIIAGAAFLGAAVGGIIATLNDEDLDVGIVAGAIGAGAGYGLGAGIAHRAWIAMIVGLLAGQLAGLAGGKLLVALDPMRDPDAFFLPYLACAAIILLPLTAALELVDLYLKRKDAEAPAPAPAGGAGGNEDGR